MPIIFFFNFILVKMVRLWVSESVSVFERKCLVRKKKTGDKIDGQKIYLNSATEKKMLTSGKKMEEEEEEEEMVNMNMNKDDNVAAGWNRSNKSSSK